ncbi:hypothetical protein OO006_00050 [Prosthecochloris sp. SCSIO W1101]|uniref:hypothetical protein n=1 Tax=Prosthecochloris sp. SCSIO W1101 TaxID=2992242 RepID=UPI00223D97F5|nr:hypothetical protein [Prosthecochloris sp. SCSIO W1101]UZJ41446.1 hypothetical protein OO006_00050 [Prosthecochloris sp. SCSIO W1101]
MPPKEKDDWNSTANQAIPGMHMKPFPTNKNAVKVKQKNNLKAINILKSCR